MSAIELEREHLGRDRNEIVLEEDQGQVRTRGDKDFGTEALIVGRGKAILIVFENGVDDALLV